MSQHSHKDRETGRPQPGKGEGTGRRPRKAGHPVELGSEMGFKYNIEYNDKSEKLSKPLLEVHCMPGIRETASKLHWRRHAENAIPHQSEEAGKGH